MDDTGNASVRSYLLLGGGLYGAFHHPTGDHRLFPGAHVGLGWRLGARRSTLIEARYNWVPDWKGGGLSLRWVGVGRSF